LEVTPEKLEIKDSIIYVTGQEQGNTKNVHLNKLAYHAHLRNKQFIGIGRIVPENASPWHAHFVEVEVNTDTGQIKVVKLTAAHDVGKAVHPVVVEGQIEGGALMGIGYALSEEIKYNEKGKQLNDSIHKYMLLTAEDVPEVDAIIVEANNRSGPFGAKVSVKPVLFPQPGLLPMQCTTLRESGLRKFR